MKCYAGAAIDGERRKFEKENEKYPAANDGRIWFASPVKPVKPRK